MITLVLLFAGSGTGRRGMTNTSQLIRSQDALALESDLKCSVVNSKFQSTQPPLCNTNRYPSFELWGVEDSVLHVFEFRDLRFQLLGYTHLHPARLHVQNRTQVSYAWRRLTHLLFLIFLSIQGCVAGLPANEERSGTVQSISNTVLKITQILLVAGTGGKDCLFTPTCERKGSD